MLKLKEDFPPTVRPLDINLMEGFFGKKTCEGKQLLIKGAVSFFIEFSCLEL